MDIIGRFDLRTVREGVGRGGAGNWAVVYKPKGNLGKGQKV